MPDTARSQLKQVKLPDGEPVTVSTKEEAWWSKQYGSGFVNPAELAPDPKNPRRQMNALELKELEESIAQKGVREPLAVTPRHLAPWAKVAPEHAGRFFIIVSGHRRHDGATKHKLQGIPVRVVVYQDEKYHRLDMSILNKGRAALSELDEGFEMVELRKLGCTMEELRKAFGHTDDQQVYNRIHLTMLAPDLQKMLVRDRAKRKLPITVGGILGGLKTPHASSLEGLFGKFNEFVKKEEIHQTHATLEELSEDELRFTLQRLLFAVIRKRNLNAQRAGEFIREHTLSLRSVNANHGVRMSPKNERYQPKNRKQILGNLAGEILGSVVVDWSDDEWRRIFELSTREEVEEFLSKFTQAAEFVTGVTKILTRLRDQKKATNPEVARLMQKKA